MTFRFPLASVLRLRRSQQRQQELLLQARINEVHRLQHNLANAEAEILRIAALPPHGRSAAEIQFDNDRLHTLAFRREEIKECLLRACAERDGAATEFRQAWQRRETLETLERQARSAFAVDQSRRDQRELDDWFLERKCRRQSIF